MKHLTVELHGIGRRVIFDGGTDFILARNEVILFVWAQLPSFTDVLVAVKTLRNDGRNSGHDIVEASQAVDVSVGSLLQEALHCVSESISTDTRATIRPQILEIV